MAVFPQGFSYKRPPQGAPDFIKGKINIKVDEAVDFLQNYKNERGWVTLELKKSKEGNLYLALDIYKPNENPEETATKTSSNNDPY